MQIAVTILSTGLRNFSKSQECSSRVSINISDILLPNCLFWDQSFDASWIAGYLRMPAPPASYMCRVVMAYQSSDVYTWWVISNYVAVGALQNILITFVRKWSRFSGASQKRWGTFSVVFFNGRNLKSAERTEIALYPSVFGVHSLQQAYHWIIVAPCTVNDKYRILAHHALDEAPSTNLTQVFRANVVPFFHVWDVVISFVLFTRVRLPMADPAIIRLLWLKFVLQCYAKVHTVICATLVLLWVFNATNLQRCGRVVVTGESRASIV